MAFFISMKNVTILFFLLALLACDKKEIVQPVEYDGPQSEAENVELFYTENQVVKVKLLADRVFEFQHGDREFPEGVYIEFFDEAGNLSSTLRANQAYYFKKDNLWKAVGKVEVVNLAKKEQLNTEELFWRPAKEDIYTDSFVTIRMETEVIYGEGLEAKQDMSSYTIKKPQGEFRLEDNPPPPSAPATRSIQ